MPGLQWGGWTYIPYTCKPINLLSIDNKIFDVIINKNFVEHLHMNDLLSDKQYGFWSALSDVQTTITHIISQINLTTVSLANTAEYHNIRYFECL